MIFICKPFFLLHQTFLLTRLFPMTFKQALVAPSLKIPPLNPCISLQLLPLFSFTAKSQPSQKMSVQMLVTPLATSQLFFSTYAGVFLFTSSSLFLLGYQWPLRCSTEYWLFSSHFSWSLFSSICQSWLPFSSEVFSFLSVCDTTLPGFPFTLLITPLVLLFPYQVLIVVIPKTIVSISSYILFSPKENLFYSQSFKHHLHALFPNYLSLAATSFQSSRPVCPTLHFKSAIA